MKQLPAILSALLFSVFVIADHLVAQTPERLEKIAEGEYWRWEGGHPIKDTAQSWTIRRTKDGFEIENKLPPDKAAALMAAFGNAFSSKMTPELKDEIENSTTTTEIQIELDHAMAVQRLQLIGRKLSDARQVEVANCAVKENEISCKGRTGGARLKNSAQSLLVYSYAFPLLFTPMLRQSKVAQGQTVAVKLGMLVEVKNKLELTEVAGQLRSEGKDQLTTGQSTFETEKFILTLETKSGARQVTLWASKQGMIFGLEDSRDVPGARILLTQFKKSADF